MKKKMNSAVLVEDEDLPNRPVLPPSHSDLALVPGTVVDYDGYRWYVHWWWWVVVVVVVVLSGTDFFFFTVGT